MRTRIAAMPEVAQQLSRFAVVTARYQRRRRPFITFNYRKSEIVAHRCPLANSVPQHRFAYDLLIGGKPADSCDVGHSGDQAPRPRAATSRTAPTIARFSMVAASLG